MLGLERRCRPLAVVLCTCFLSAGHTEPLVLVLDEKKFCFSTSPPSIIEKDIAEGVCAPRGCFFPVFLSLLCTVDVHTLFHCVILYYLLLLFPQTLKLFDSNSLCVCICPGV